MQRNFIARNGVGIFVPLEPDLVTERIWIPNWATGWSLAISFAGLFSFTGLFQRRAQLYTFVFVTIQRSPSITLAALHDRTDR